MISSSLGAMESLLGKLHKLLNSPPEHQLPPKSLKEGMIEHLTRLTWDLEEINRLLVDLARVKGPNAMAKRWMNEVRELSYDMEDYIDSTMRSNMTASSGMNKEILPEVRKFRTLVKQAHERHQRYELRRWASKNPASCVVHGKGQLPSFEGKATDLVGIGEPRDELIRWLKNIDEAEGKLKVVSILGPAGVGKSTLAQEVYREIGVQFERRAFVRASRVPDTRRLLRSIISQVHRHQRRPPCGLPVQELVNNLRTHLQQKRYFILIDGLWETMSWDIIKKAFPEGIYGSRILVVTDIVEVALECCDHHYNTTTWATEPQLDSGPHFHNSQVGIFQMEKLSTDDSLELFLNKVFGSKNELSEQLKMYAEEIIRKCSGLPLAIITIASVLACQPENSDLWRHIVECLSSRNTLTSEELLREIIGLSYYSLSQELKTCLLYLSLYPEGYTFKVDLVKQWTAEGFITAVADKDMNEVAEFYFDELVSRGFVQHNLNFSDDVMFYTVHSTIFEVIKRKSIEENFTTVIDYSETIPKLSAKVRRLSLSFSNAKYATKPEGFKLSPVRSLAFYGLAECLPSIMEFKLLRVLVLEFWGDRKEFDLSGIFILLQLRYVRVTSDMIIKLPAKMQGLQYLETLEIYASVLTVPSDIVHLPKLLHLHLQGDIKLPDYVGKLKSLRTLEYFDLSSNTEGNVRSLCEMTNLQHLHITCSAAPSSDHLERNLIALASLIGGLKSLKSLTIAPLCVPCSSIYMDCSSVVSSLPYCLEKFELLPPICMFSRLPVWIGQLQNLRVLKIVVRELRRDDVNRIAGLQALTVLSLYVRQPNAESIVFNSATFPVLKYLKFRCGVLRLAFQAEAMPNLRRLKLEFNAHSGEKYRDMLAGIEHLLNLQEIAVRIGAAPGAEESDKAAAESAFMDTIGKHSKHLCFRVRNADTFEEEGEQFSDKADDIEPMCSQESTVRIGAAPGAEEPAGRAGQSVSRDTSFSIQTAADPVPVDEEIQQFSDPAASSSNSDRVLPRSIMTDVTYQSNEIVDPKAANDPEIQTDPHRGVPKFGNWVAEGDEHYTQYFENARKGKSPTWERRGSSERNRRTAPNTPRIPNRRPSGCAYETVQPERASAMPKFGEWETTSDSNDGYYHIFNKVREERISAERDRKYNDNTVLASAGAASYSDSNDGYSAIFERASEKRTAGRDRKYGDNAVTTGAGSGGYNHSNQSFKKKNHSNQGRKHKSACCSCFSCFED